MTGHALQDAVSATRPPTGRSALGSATIPATLAMLHVDPQEGLSPAEIDDRRKIHGYNEVPEPKRHPIRQFAGKFWGISAWMLELIIILSIVLRQYADLVVVSGLLVVNAILAFLQEQSAAVFIAAILAREGSDYSQSDTILKAARARPPAGPACAIASSGELDWRSL